MMFRGTVQLLLYRLVYHDLVIGIDQVVGLGRCSRFLTTNYLRYLHVSGQFHLAIGMLHLFGFSLPETHHKYLLASSFTDYWRRINIYWKDFMVRVVFNPVAFRLKRRPQWLALLAATAVGVRRDVVPARLPVVLDQRLVGLLVRRTPSSGRSSAASCWSTSSSTPARPAAGRSARRPTATRVRWPSARSRSSPPSRRSPCSGRSGRARASTPGWRCGGGRPVGSAHCGPIFGDGHRRIEDGPHADPTRDRDLRMDASSPPTRDRCSPRPPSWPGACSPRGLALNASAPRRRAQRPRLRPDRARLL